MILVTVFFSILNQMEFHFVQKIENRRENCHHDHISFNMKGKQSPRSYPIQYKRKWKHSILSVSTRETDEEREEKKNNQFSFDFEPNGIPFGYPIQFKYPFSI